MGYLGCIIDSIGNQPRLCPSGIGCVSSYAKPCPMLQCILTQTNEQDCCCPVIFTQCHTSLSHVMLRPRQFSLTGKYPDSSCHLRQQVRSSALMHINTHLPCLCVGAFSSPIRHVPLVLEIMNVVENYAHCWRKMRLLLPSNGNIAASSKVNLLSFSAYSIDTQLMCNPAKDFITSLLVMSWIGVMHVTWLDMEQLRNKYSFDYQQVPLLLLCENS